MRRRAGIGLVFVLGVAACGKSGDGASGGSATATGGETASAAPVAAAPATGSAELGRMLYEKKGCVACHSIDGSARVGPSLLGAASRATTSTRFTDGTLASDLIGEGKKFPAVRDYLVASFMQPLDHIIEGFPPTAPSFQGVLKPHEVESLVLFLESLAQP